MTITNYALIAYAALAAAPAWLGTKSWLVPVSLCAFVLVWAAAYQAHRLLADIQDAEDMERDRLHAARSRLRLIRQIHKGNPHYVDKEPTETPIREYRKWWQLPPLPRRWLGFSLMLGLGAAIASLIILSRLPWCSTVAVVLLLLLLLVVTSLISFWRSPWRQQVVASIRGSAPRYVWSVQTGGAERAHEPPGDRPLSDRRGARELTGDEGMTEDVGPWIIGGVMALVALLGLRLASGAQDDVIYGTGLGLFVFAVLFIFFLIHRSVGR